MAAVQHVEFNDSGDWKFALVTGQGVGGPGNYNLLVNVDGGRLEPYENVQEGGDSGNWREPK